MNHRAKFPNLEPVINFRELCLKKQNKNNTDIFEDEEFFEVVLKLNNRHPFLIFDSILKDFLFGVYTSRILKKNNLSSSTDLNSIIKTNFKINPNRIKSNINNNANVFQKNISMSYNHKAYYKFKGKFEEYSKELSTLYNYNVLRGLIITYLIETDSRSIDEEKLLEFIGNNISSINSLQNKSKYRLNFLEFLKLDTSKKILKILKHLENMNFITMLRENRFYLNLSKQEIEEKIIGIVEKEKAGTYYDNFARKLFNENHLLLLIPETGLWEQILKNLVKLDKIKIIPAYWRYSPQRDQLFTKENLDWVLKIIEEENKSRAKQVQVKFFGRKINPEQFIEELQELEIGDFEANDDQVTRIAGLVLAESVKLEAPHENIPMFDFAVNMKNYQFRPEQIDAMNKLDFELTSQNIHCKVMINKSIDKKLVMNLRNYLPKNHQGVIITFSKISNSLKSELEKDKTIQIIDKEGLKMWVSITNLIPARINSIAIIKFDPFNDLYGNVARVDSMNYETGMAGITLIPSLKEFNVYIRSLQEIEIPTTVDRYLTYAKNYYKFLNFLSKISDENDFKNALLKNHIDYNQCLINQVINNEYQKSIKPSFKFKINSHTVGIDFKRHSMRGRFQCTCYKWESNSEKLCEHLILCLDLAVRNNDFLDSIPDDSNSEQNVLNEMSLEIIKELTVNNLESVLLDISEEKQFLINKFLEMKQKSLN